MNRSSAYFLSTFAAAALVVLGCTSTPTQLTNSPGGSGTETVGILVDAHGSPVAQARVSAFIVSGATTGSLALPETTVETNARGIFTFAKLPVDTFRCEALSIDSSLVGQFTFVRPDTDSLYLGTDTLYPPGRIAGRALLTYDSNMTGTTVYLPGTSFTAITDDTGGFTISGVPPGTYSVYFMHVGYTLGSDANVVVRSSQTTQLLPVQLAIDPSAPPPTPKGLRYSIDTAAGIVTLWWDSVVLADLRGFTVFRDSAGAGLAVVGSTQRAVPRFFDTLRLSSADTTPVTLRYEVETVDTLGNLSQFSLPVNVAAPSAWFVATSFSWIKVKLPDTLTNADRFTIAVQYRNPTRGNNSLSWYVGSPATLVKRVPEQTSSGYDTLTWQIATPGLVHLRVSATDDAGSVWSDSIALDVIDSNVLLPRDTWMALSPLSSPRGFAGCASLGGKVYVAGGYVFNLIGSNSVPSPLATMLAYDPAKDLWTPKASLKTARSQFALVACNDRLYAIGGISPTADINTIEEYDTAADSWTVVDTMAGARHGLAAVAINDTIYCFGGIIRDSTGYVFTSRIDAWSPAGNAWVAKGFMTTPRSNHQAVVLGGEVYVMAGEGGAPLLADVQPLSSVESYNPSTQFSALITPLAAARFNFSAAVADGKIIAAGGAGSVTNPVLLSSVESFDPASGYWTRAKDMTAPRQAMAGCGVNNMLIVAGGVIQWVPGAGNVVGTVEKYYP